MIAIQTQIFEQDYKYKKENGYGGVGQKALQWENGNLKIKLC